MSYLSSYRQNFTEIHFTAGWQISEINYKSVKYVYFIPFHTSFLHVEPVISFKYFRSFQSSNEIDVAMLFESLFCGFLAFFCISLVCELGNQLNEPIAFNLLMKRNQDNRRQYKLELTILDANDIEHPLPCECNQTKCILVKEHLKLTEGCEIVPELV